MRLNRAMEIHDSVLEVIKHRGTTVILEFDAYIHESAGEPAVDEGTGWSQRLAIEVSNAKIERELSKTPCDLYSGYIDLAGDRSENIIPIPLDHTDVVAIGLDSQQRESLLVKGDSAKLMILGEAQFIEDFHP
jgi:hypothetical protein